jgi:hypothetical protein
MSDMRRRQFIALLGGAAAAWPLAARAQPSAKMPTIGYLGGGGPTGQRAWVDAFVQRLHELGWIEGRAVAIEYRWGEGRSDRYAEIAAEFVRLKVDGPTCDSSADDLLATEPMRAAPSGEIVMARSLLTQKQHERANQRKHAHTNSEAIGLDQNVVVDQHDAERCRQHDGERNQENDNPVLHGRSAGRAHLSPRAPHP